MLPSNVLRARRHVALRVQAGGKLWDAVQSCAATLAHSMNKHLAQELALDAKHWFMRCTDNELGAYELALAVHDWDFRSSKCRVTHFSGAAENNRLSKIADKFDRDRKIWKEYGPCGKLLSKS